MEGTFESCLAMCVGETARRRGQGYKDAGVAWRQEHFGWSGAGVNKILLRALVECAAFAELSGEDVIDPDAAVALMEQLATLLGELEPRDRVEFIAFVEALAASERAASGENERARFLAGLPEAFGLGD